MDTYGFNKGYGIQFYGIVNGQLLVAICPEEDAKRLNGKRGDSKVPYFQHSSTNEHLAELGYIPKSEDCTIELQFNPASFIKDVPEGYNFYVIQPTEQTESSQEENKQYELQFEENKAYDGITGEEIEIDEPEYEEVEELEELVDNTRLDF